MDMREYLNRFKDLWKQAEEEKEGYDFPDGQWRFQLAEGTIYPSKKSGKATALLVCVAVGGEHHGKVHRQYWPLETAWGINFLRAFLEGVNAKVPGHDNPGEAVDTLADLANARIEFTADLQTQASRGGGQGGFRTFKVVAQEGDQVRGTVEPACEFSVGDRVVVEIDGDDYGGEIGYLNFESRVAEVKFDDGDTAEVEFDQLKVENRLLSEATSFCHMYDIEPTGDLEAITERITQRAALEGWTKETFTLEEVSLLGELGVTLKEAKPAKKKGSKKKKKSS
jgi:hypothetical protein